jgi:hypothetical protein
MRVLLSSKSGSHPFALGSILIARNANFQTKVERLNIRREAEYTKRG